MFLDFSVVRSLIQRKMLSFSYPRYAILLIQVNFYIKFTHDDIRSFRQSRETSQASEVDTSPKAFFYHVRKSFNAF